MQHEISSRSLQGISDLVVWAPIKEGFIHAFENVTYATRARIAAEALHNIRAAAREFEPIAFFTDTAEGILDLLDFRIGIVDKDLYQADFPRRGAGAKSSRTAAVVHPRQYLYVVATFDEALEPYLRLIWKPLGPFLDTLLCNCEGYVPATENSFSDYLKWVRAHQLESSIFNATTAVTVRDQIYLAEADKMRRGALPGSDELSVACMHIETPENKAELAREAALKLNPIRGEFEIQRQALEVLTVLYRLADYYPPTRLSPETSREAAAANADPNDPDPGDGRFLLRAATSLLEGWQPDQLPDVIKRSYAEPLAWFGTDLSPTPVMATPPDPVREVSDVQAGILTDRFECSRGAVHGALLLLQVTDPVKARKFLRDYRVSWEGEADAMPTEEIQRNLGFTFPGLERLQLAPDDLLSLPKEFRDGMEERAPSMGDVRESHPRNWILPTRNWPPRTTASALAGIPVELSEVDVVIQLRLEDSDTSTRFLDFQALAAKLSGAAALLDDTLGITASDALAATANPDPNHPLAVEISRLGSGPDRSGLQLIAIESAIRHAAEDSGDPPGPYSGYRPEHFGFRDGISQPVAQFGIGDPDTRPAFSQDVRVGELLLGYRNDHQDFAPAGDDGGEAGNIDKSLPDYMVGSSFLVIRKIAQNRAAFEDLLDSNVSMGTLAGSAKREEIAARLIGRYRSGEPLVGLDSPPFDYAADAEGVGCPYTAHIRRTNPRDTFQERRVPRLLRRGMSYGPRWEDDKDADRGILFMAYNASIAEQFETVQRWINGGNSTFVGSAQNDPVVGVGPPPGEARLHRFVYEESGNRQVIDLRIDTSLTRLQWGVYLFVPSRPALERICDEDYILDSNKKYRKAAEIAGQDLISEIEALPQALSGPKWKALLEDFETKDPVQDNISGKVWQAILSRGGAYKLPFKQITPPGYSNSTWDLVLDKEERDRITDVIASAPVEPSGTTAADADSKPRGVILVADRDLIQEVLSDSTNFLVKEQGRRFTCTTAAIYVAMDAGERYDKESLATNRILFEEDEKAAYAMAYGIAANYLRMRCEATDQIFEVINSASPHDIQDPFFKFELRREYIMPVLGELCRAWFDIPDNLGDGNTTPPTSKYVGNGPWGWLPPWTQKDVGCPGMRQPRCPGDFMAQSRDAFYPRPTRSIHDFAVLHGEPLKQAVHALVEDYRRQPDLLRGTISTQMFKAIPEGDLLYRNLLGIMVGMLPPSDANLRAVFFDWLSDKTLWQHQAALHRASENAPASYDHARIAIRDPIEAAMRKRPAPDLIYRTAARDCRIGRARVRKGDMVILSLVAATLWDGADVTTIFGGERTSVPQPDGAPMHACPAYKMAMGSMMGIVAALLDVGRIQAQPASLIVRISDWQR